MNAPLRVRAALVAAVVVASACGSTSPTPSPSPTRAPSPLPTATAVPGSACLPATTPASEDWNRRTWYEVFVRSFADGDGDGIGDLRGLTAKLDYLNDGDPSTTGDLGVGGLWLMPVAQAASYHGYDVTDYRTVERDYGTNEDFRAFVAAAHERGIDVIVDLVMNHTSSEHPWFQDSRTPGSDHDDWYVWATEKPMWLGPDGQVVWHKLDDRWFYGAFWEGMPDLNLRSPAVTAELEDIARFWLTDMGVDGFRLDAVKHLVEDGKQQVNTPDTLAWLEGFNAATDAAKPGSLLVGEVWDPPSVAAAYAPEGVDLTFDFGLATGVRLAIQNGRAAPLVTALTDTVAAWPVNRQASFLSNHDQERIMSQLAGDLPSARLAAFLLLTEPGLPFIYYGEEIGMTGRKPDERIRTPMQWSADDPAAGFSTVAPWQELGEDWQAVNVAAQAGDPGSLLTTYRDLIRLRTSSAALREGATTLLDGGADRVVAWLRTTADETVLVVANVGDEPVSEYGLTLDGGPLCGEIEARLLGTVGGDPAAAVTVPRVTVEGGLDAWAPLGTLDPRSGYVIALEPSR